MTIFSASERMHGYIEFRGRISRCAYRTITAFVSLKNCNGSFPPKRHLRLYGLWRGLAGSISCPSQKEQSLACQEGGKIRIDPKCFLLLSVNIDKNLRCSRTCRRKRSTLSPRPSSTLRPSITKQTLLPIIYLLI